MRRALVGDGVAGMAVLVTGAANGIGKALVLSLLALGARVVAVDRDSAALDRLPEGDTTAQLLRLSVDLTQHEELGTTFDAAAAWASGIDAVVHCAGYGPYRPFLDYQRSDWDLMMALNLTAYADLVRLALPGMLQRQRGHLIAIGSERGQVQTRGTSIYGATKAGLAAFSHGLAMDYGGQGIHTCVVAPGGVLTDFGGRSAQDKDPRFLSPEDVADSVIFMLSHRGRAFVRDLVLLPLGV
jgi:3-hydroxy acid dehydrogenase / malonic semialdehyde reductase